MENWKRNTPNGQNSNWKTFLVTFREHLGDRGDVRVIVKERNEQLAINKAETIARTFDRTIDLFGRCEQCGDQFWRASALSPDIKGDFSSLQDWALTIENMRESEIKGALAIEHRKPRNARKAI